MQSKFATRVIVATKPVNARKDLVRSKPDSAVWVLKCETNIYRVRLVPEIAARVQHLK